MTTFGQKATWIMPGEIISKELQPDIAICKKKRHMEEYQKRRLFQTRMTRNEVNQIHLKMAKSVKALICPGHAEPEETESMAKIPGFRYRANGDEKISFADIKRTRLWNVMSGDRPKQENKTPWRGNSSGFSSSKGTSADSINRSVTSESDDGDGRDLSGQPHHKKKFSGILDESASFRIRKMQEQLGLKRRQLPYEGSVNSLDRHRAADKLEHAIKGLYIVLRNAEVDSTLMPGSSRPGFKNRSLERTDSFELPQRSNNAYSSADQVMPRNRCEACYYQHRTDVKELVKYMDLDLYRKPRWKPVPSGRYVSPPINKIFSQLLHPLCLRGTASDPSSQPPSRRATSKSKFKRGGSDTSVSNRMVPDLRPFGVSSALLPSSPRQRAFNIPFNLEKTNAHGAGSFEKMVSILELANSLTLPEAPNALTSPVLPSLLNRELNSMSSVPTQHQSLPPESRSVSLGVLKKRNDKETQILENKIKDFLESLSKSPPLSNQSSKLMIRMN